MKRVIAVFALSLVLSIFSISAVQAEDSSGSSIGDRLKEKREERLDKFQEKGEALKDKFASKASDIREKRRAKIKEVFNKILNHLGNASERLTKITAKIQNRLDKIKAKGIDTTSWQTALDACKQNKSSIEAAIADAKSKIDAVDEQATGASEQVKVAREAVAGVKVELHNYKKCLVDVTRQIKASKDLRGASESAN